MDFRLRGVLTAPNPCVVQGSHVVSQKVIINAVGKKKIGKSVAEPGLGSGVTVLHQSRENLPEGDKE